MTATIPSCEPEEIVAGDTVAWTRTLSSYPAGSGWTLHYRILGTDLDVEISDTGSSGEYELELGASDTEDIVTEIDARLIGWVASGLESYTIYSGAVRVLPNLRTATATESLTHVERMLAAIQAKLEGRVTADVARYGREGAFVDKLELRDLLSTQGVYKGKLWRQQNEGKLMPVNVMRFVSAAGGSEAERRAWPGMDL